MTMPTTITSGGFGCKRINSTSANDAEVPFQSSITFIATVSFMASLVSFLWALYDASGEVRGPGEVWSQHHRGLNGNCNITSTSSQDPNVVSTWQAIRSTLIISASLGLLCLLGFEAFRRDPIIGKYVYDRKRLSQPGRSPPPLMLSRSLWRGPETDDDEENDGKKHRSTCCTVRPAICEIAFLNLDKNYIRYSQEAYEARIEREKRGYYACCRTGCYHNNCCNGRRLMNLLSANGEDDGFFVDDDGYAFFPGHVQDYTHIYQVINQSYSYSPQKRLKRIVSLPAESEASLETNEVQSPKRQMNATDLFPEDDPRKYFATCQPEGSHSLLDSSPTNDEFLHQNREGERFMTPTGSEATNSFRVGDIQSLGSIGSFQSATSIGQDDAEEKPNGASAATGEKGGTSLEHNGTSVTLTEAIMQSEGIEEEKSSAGSRCKDIPHPTDRNGIGNGNEEEVGVGTDNGSPRTKKLRYPYRLKYLFMPPGFHTWTNAFEFLGYFFYLTALFRWLRKSMKWMPISSPMSIESIRPSVDIANPGKDLTDGEKELLRCAGLDTYLLIRLARFGFDVTFYPFWTACVVVLPIYYSCNDQAHTSYDDGYLSLTINRVPDGSKKLIWIAVFSMLLYLFIMRRLWLEWEVFIKLRHSFLANGDTSFHKRPTYLKKYRNTCMVECVPKTHRTDRNIGMVFESLFPGQIEHAEMLIDTSKLEEILRKRRNLIEKYDDFDSRYRYECWRHAEYKQGGKLIGCGTVAEPVKPKVKSGGLCSREKEDAFDYFNGKIKEADQLARQEYDNIVQTRMKWRDENLLKSVSSLQEDSIRNSAQFTAQNLYSLFVPSRIRKDFFGEQTDFFCGTGMVTFKSISSKQSAVQCNLSGQPYFMITDDAPDPRDLFWSNVGVDRKLLENRKILVNCLLLIGVLAWGTIVGFIHKFTQTTLDWFSLDSILGPVVQGYLPVLVVSLVLLWLPNLFFMLAMRVIRFKSHTQCDEYVLVWNTGYRLANIFFTFFSITILEVMECLRDNPEEMIQTVADGIIKQSTFLMNLIIVATGQETMLQLLQWRSLIKQAVFRPFINLNARSRRYIDWLNEAPQFEQSFIFGFFAPVLSYGLMIAMVFAFTAPIMLAVCATFFWTASKVHTHNALFVYCQKCEGGGKIFYYWNRIVFITLYTSIVIFSAILALKQAAELGAAFVGIMLIITYCVDKSVQSTFVIHSLHLPISIARIHDEEEVALLAESNTRPTGRENYMYRHPILDPDNWDSKPTWS